VSQVDVVAIGAHPDDIELGCGGILRLLADQGYRVGVIDLTEGELGSRGSVELRREEAAQASEILGISERINLGIPDGGIENTKENQLKIIRAIRGFRPDIVLVGAPECRHPDHVDATDLCISALFYSGLRMVDEDGGDAWRPGHILHYMQALTFDPTFVVDVSTTWTRRMEAVLAYKSQFHNPDYRPADDEPETYISNPGFLGFVEARARMLGYRIGAEFGEGLLYHQGPFGIDDLVATLQKERRK
jgi:bacillithiol biosynthesis deacetylase BshB1